MSIFIKTGLWENRKDTDAPKGWFNLSKYISSNSSGGEPKSIKLTRAEILSLQASSSFIVGSNYTIIDADPNLYGGTEVTLTAITPSELSLQGSGKFYCPKYDLSADGTGYGIWTKQMEGSFSNILSTFVPNEIVISNNGATAKYLAEGLLEWISGEWASSISIEGVTGRADISGFITPSYTIGQVVHWGGKSWTNVNGNIGTSIDKYTLDSEWQEIPFNETDYNVYVDEIHYDFGNDMIIYRKDRYNNVVRGSHQVFVEFTDVYSYGNPIKDFQWGCMQNDFNTDDYLYGGIQGNEVVDSYFETLNTLAKYIQLNKLSQLSYIANTTLSRTISFISNTFSNNSYFDSNTLSGSSHFVSNNLNNSYIDSNTLSGSSYISRNTLNDCDISNNTLNGGSFIEYNTSNGGIIDSNTLNGCNIFNNILNKGSNISNNTLNGRGGISENILNGSSFISNNTLNGNRNFISINFLNNNSNIFNNTLNGDSSFSFNVLNTSSGISENILSSSNIERNTLKNSSGLQFTGGTLSGKSVNKLTMIGGNSLISISATIIFNSNISKTIFQREDGTSRLQYVNNSDAIVITDINT